jgi:hypothetical protein
MPEVQERVAGWGPGVLQIAPEHDGRWVVRSDRRLVSTHGDATDAQRAACALARGSGATRVLLRDSYGRTRDLPVGR